MPRPDGFPEKGFTPNMETAFLDGPKTEDNEKKKKKKKKKKVFSKKKKKKKEEGEDKPKAPPFGSEY